MTDNWLLIKDAPLDVQGHVWSPELGDRTDVMGSIYAYGDGSRGVSSTARGFSFTHWHPLPARPDALGGK